jgi:hypothetical protein
MACSAKRWATDSYGDTVIMMVLPMYARSEAARARMGRAGTRTFTSTGDTAWISVTAVAADQSANKRQSRGREARSELPSIQML